MLRAVDRQGEVGHQGPPPLRRLVAPAPPMPAGEELDRDAGQPALDPVSRRAVAARRDRRRAGPEAVDFGVGREGGEPILHLLVAAVVPQVDSGVVDPLQMEGGGRRGDPQEAAQHLVRRAGHLPAEIVPQPREAGGDTAGRRQERGVLEVHRDLPVTPDARAAAPRGPTCPRSPPTGRSTAPAGARAGTSRGCSGSSGPPSARCAAGPCRG